MKRLALLILVFLIALHAHATKYYVASNGNNTNDGLSESAPWQALNYAVQNIKKGDTLLLHKGDIFRESADFYSKAIIHLYIGNYGTAKELPVVSGAIAISGWTKWKDNIYTASIPQTIQNLYVNSKLMTIARYPNNGWLRVASATSNGGKTNLACSALSANPNNATGYWKNATMRWRRWSWWFEQYTVVDYNSNGTLIFNTIPSSNGIDLTQAAGWGFYLDNVLTELDSETEWYQDKAAKKVYLWAPGGIDPSSLLVEGSVLSLGMKVDSSVVDGICFKFQTSTGLGVTGISKVTNCRFEGIGSDAGGNALEASWDIENSSISNNTFINNLNNSISWNQNPAQTTPSYIEMNHLKNCGMVPGYGGSGSWHANAVVIMNGQKLHIQYNIMEDVGYCGVIMGHDGNFVDYNRITRAMSTLNDGAAIYCNCSNTKIRHNIIIGTVGNLESSRSWANLGHGIWPEFLSDFRKHDIEYNTVANSGGFGLFIPNNFYDTIRYNNLYNNARGQIDLSGEAAKGPQGHVIENNILFAAGAKQTTINYIAGLDYGTVRNNYFANPLNGFETNGYAAYQWNSMYSWVKGGNRTDSIKLPQYRAYNRGTELIADPAFNLDVADWTADPTGIPLTITSASDQPEMDGKCMKTLIGIGKNILQRNISTSMTIGQFYELRMDYLFEKMDLKTNIASSSTFTITLTNEENKLISSFNFPASDTRKRAWVVLYPMVNASSVQVKITHTSSVSNNLWIDNFSLKQVDAQEHVASQESKILINDTTFKRNFYTGPGKWRNLYGTLMADSISIDPFSSIILVRYEDDTVAGAPKAVAPNIKAELKDKIQDDINVFPVPVSDLVFLTNIPEHSSIFLFDLNGKMIKHQTVQSKEQTIDCSDLSAGIYIFVIQTSERKVIKKIIKE